RAGSGRDRHPVRGGRRALDCGNEVPRTAISGASCASCRCQEPLDAPYRLRKNPSGVASMAEVFISYARSDRPSAQALALELQRLGIDVWWDHDLLGGEDYRKRINEVLSRASAVIVMWSRRSVESQFVMGEASAARERGVLVPISLDDAA